MAKKHSRATAGALPSSLLESEHASKLYDAIHDFYGLAHCLRVLGRADLEEGEHLISSDALHALGVAMLGASARALDALDAMDTSLQGDAK